MVDDSMEISSDHDHEPGDDDIDIDIDIMTGQVDEDDILDDATSNMDPAESSFPQLSPVVAADDIMVDEDDETYAMNDADLFQDEQERTMDQENMETSSVPANKSHFDVNEKSLTGNAAVEDLDSVGELVWEQEGNPSLDLDPSLDYIEPSFENIERPLQNSADTDHQAAADVSSEKISTEIDLPVDVDYVHDSKDSSPQANSPKDVTKQDAGSPASSESAQNSSSRQNSVQTTPAVNIADAVASTESETRNITVSDSSAGLPTMPQIVVLYQSIEYALFGASDSEDPDSFFLTDSSIFDKSISDFFKAMRNVIYEDLNPEEELCLSVDDLGLEIEETVSTLHDVTLAQILKTYEMLLHNDEVDTPRPLCLSVGTRPSFAKRLANLIACAAEGKGLSQLISLDEQPSEGFDESGVPNEDLYAHVETGSTNGNGRHDDNDRIKSNQTEKRENDSSHLDAEAGQDRPRSSSDQQEEKQDKADDSVSLAEDTQQQAVKHDDLLDTEESLKNDLHSDAYVEDEENDLIDYSEEGDHTEVGQKRTITQDTQATSNGDNADDVTEYEAINKELRRRSTSRAAEQSLDEKIEEQALNVGRETDGEENFSHHDGGVSYDLDNADDQWNDVDIEQYHDLSAENIDFAVVEQGEGDYHGSMADTDEGHRIVESSATNVPRAQSAAEEVEIVREISRTRSGGEDRSKHHDDEQGEDALEDYSNSYDEPNVPTTNGEWHSHESINSKMGATDVANSSATLSADEHQDADEPEFLSGSVDHFDLPTSPEHSEATVHIHIQDEIDYEDDEEEQDIIRHEVPTTQEESPAKYGGPGKRTRADGDSDDNVSSRGQDTKRHRS